MNKKVLILSSSPRKNGNSDMLCNEFMRGATAAGHNAEKIFLADKKIGYCRGCGVCNSTHKCVQRDDASEILEKMLDADVIVMASPVYFYTMCGQMKTMIDRTVPCYTDIKNKEFYFIITAADENKKLMGRTIDGFRGFTDDCLTNPIEKGIIYATGVWHIGDIEGTKYLKEAYEMGKNI